MYSDLRRILDGIYLSGLFSFVLGIISLPLQVLGAVINFFLRNLLLCIWVMMLAVLMLNVSESSSSVLSTLVNTYNAGIGSTVDLLVIKPLQVFDILFRGLVPLYNAFAWILSQVFMKVLVPFLGFHVDRLPRLVGDFSLGIVTFGRAGAILTGRYVECGGASSLDSANNVSRANVERRPFTPSNMQCIANTNYLTFDLMTPGLYVRKTMLHVHYLVTSSCSILTAPLDIVLYPFLDFNLYKTIHCAANTILHVIIAIPLITHNRCQYGKDPLNDFSQIEQAVMCAPDWKPGFLMFTSGIRSLGKLVDNWLNIVLLVVEHNVGRKTIVCAQSATVGSVWDGVDGIFESRDKPMKVVGMSQAMITITDGSSAAFHNLVDGASTVWAIGIFPFPIDPRLGVSPIRYGEVFDADENGDVRTGLFGCKCFDRTEPSGIESIEVVCSSVPFQTNHHDNDEAYAANTVQRVVFDRQSATNAMSCSRTLIRVSALRFSRKRFSSASQDGIDSPFADPFNAMGSSGSSDMDSYAADAMLYIQPLCDGPRESCLAGIDNCFPWCMGLHVAGQRNQQLRVFNARKWEDSVTLAQTDCVASASTPSPCVSGTGARIVNLDTNFTYDSACGVSIASCRSQDSTSTVMSLDNLRSENNTLLSYRKQTLPMVRLGSQPFVAAGDVFLHQHELSDSPGEYELVVSRLYDHKLGLYSMKSEQLSLLSNRQTVRLKLCDTEADVFCYYNALMQNTIILPRSYMLSANTNIAVTSEWAVHWAVNPENAIFQSVLDFCSSGSVGFTVNVASSYSRPRVWTLKTMRASSVNPSRRESDSDIENGLYSYMVVPDWVVFDGSFSREMCDKESNFGIVDLEYLNENNVLVTTLYTTMRHYQGDGTVCEGCPYEYKRYFLNPNRHDCVAPDEGDGTVFSCWRHERMGMFVDNEIPVEVYGSFCPALQRMPMLGSLKAEAFLIATHSVHVVLDALTTLLVIFARQEALEDASELWQLRLEKPTFHSMLDSSGSDLLDFDEVVRSLDKAALYASDVIVRSGKVFAGTPAYAMIEPVLAGTAKVLQHTAGFVPLQGPLGRQYTAVQELFRRQTQRVSNVAASSVKGSAWGFVSGAAMNFVRGPVSGFKLCMRLFKKITVKQFTEFTKKSARRLRSKAQATAKRTASTVKTQSMKIVSLAAVLQLKDVLVTTIAENTDEVDRSFLDNFRVVCDGAAQIVGFDSSLGRSVKHSCLLFPDLLKSTMTLVTVLFVDYPIMTCVCKGTEEQVRIDVISEQCMLEMTPNHWRVWILQQRDAASDDATNLCYSGMDLSNQRLMTAFDPVSSRLVKLVDALQGLLNYVVITVGLDTGKCNDFNSPYMVSIMPEPADYFMPCINTPDCRIKCLDVYNAFDSALTATTAKPNFVSRIDLQVESKYFSLDDIENQRHLPPFKIIGMSELYPAACFTVCDQTVRIDNRCLAVVGSDVDRHTVGIAYYCIPSDITQHVYEYTEQKDRQFQNTTWSHDEVITEAHLATLHLISDSMHDNVIVVTQDRFTMAQTVHLYTSEQVEVVLLQTAQFQLETYNYVTDMTNAAYVLNSIEKIRVMPATGVKDMCDLYIVGQKVYIQYPTSSSGVRVPTQTTARVCMRKSFTVSQDDATRPLQMSTSDCTEHIDAIFVESHLPICLNEECSDVLGVPTIIKSRLQEDTFTERYSITDQRFWEPQNKARFYGKRAGSSSLAQLIGFDASDPLYVTAKQQAVVNKKQVSSVAKLYQGTRNIEDGSVTVDVLVTGSVSSHRSWIQSIRLRLDSKSQEFDAGIFTSTLTNASMQVQLQCSIDNCVGCQTNPWDFRHVDLQSKCYAASRCGVQKCVATAVDMRKPLCNIASVLVDPLNAVRIVLHSGWKLLAGTIISIVELSKQRQDANKWEFPDSDIMQWNCLAKDTVVETVAVFTSGLGLVVRSVGLVDNSFSEDMMRTSIMDARWYGRYFMSTTALTNFIASVFLFPIYTIMSGQKVLSCASSDIVALIDSAVEGEASSHVVISSQNEARSPDSRNAEAEVCLSQRMSERMHELGLHGSDATKSAMSNEFVSILNRIDKVGTSLILQSLSAPFDVLVTWAIGVTSTFLDWVQTIDWKHCSLPSIVHQYVFTCVCGDKPYAIRPDLRSQSVSDNAFWCSGPMFMLDQSGNDRLIWNPYSLDELTAAELDHNKFLSCLAQGVSCDRVRARLPDLERQSVNVMPVITKCRENYKNKRWDSAVLTLGLFSAEQWLDAPQSLRNKNIAFLDVSDQQQQFQRRIASMASIIPSINIDESLWKCLNEAATTGNAAMEGVCRRAFTGLSDDAYFAYTLTESKEFTDIDACLSFSGHVSSINPINNASKTPSLWSAGSRNTMPLAERHEVLLSSHANRIKLAEDRLEDLFTRKILPALQTVARNISDNLRTDLWSMEGDELHQFVDCIVLGPFASADLFSSFDMSGGGGKFRVPRYHRGDENSRLYSSSFTTQQQQRDRVQATGSESRRRIIDATLAFVQDKTDNITRAAAVNRVNLIRSVFQDKDNFLCTCGENQVANMSCCQRDDWNSIADIHFYTKDLFADIYNLQGEVLSGAMDAVFESDLLSRIWTGSEFAYMDDVPLSEAEQVELAHAFVFDFRNPVREYTASEVPVEISGVPLWQRCTALLSASFFTMPLAAGTQNVDANMHYDPTSDDSEEYLHGMERAIHEILHRAKKDSPVFWSNSHRYVASDSVWCESSDPPSPDETAPDAFSPQRWYEQDFGLETVRGGTVRNAVFVGDMASKCLCGWVSGESCHVPVQCTDLHPEADMSLTWKRLCNNTYSSREDLFDLMHILQTSTFDPSVVASCRDLVPDVVWGLLSPADQFAWFSQDDSVPVQVDLKHIAVHGPAGVRLGLFAMKDSPNSLAAYVQQHQLLQRDPRHPRSNRKMRHTIAQPVCASGMREFLKDDLTSYFRDVLFPMAHSVNQAPAAAYCSTWAVEHSIELAMQQIYNHTSNDAMRAQTQTVILWRKRCDIQLKQIGICLLRGVYDLVPENTQHVPAHCGYTVAENHGCSSIFYVTEQCIVRCDAEFYEPCLCSADLCSDISFARDTCATGVLSFNPLNAVTDESILLYSMNWPKTLPANEGGVVRVEELNKQLQTIHASAALVTFDDDSVLQSMAKQIALQQPEDETRVPHAHCDDLLDYFDEDAQHPVGYHPTCACMRAETNMRGFDSWMSTPHESQHAWAVDPVRLRNMSQYSTGFGSSHLVCDAMVYGAHEHQLNGLDLASRWDATAPADASVPRAARVVPEADMGTLGVPTGDQHDTPLVPSHIDNPLFRHSTGLVRDWVMLYGQDAELEAAVDSLWPHWIDDKFDAYGSQSETVPDNCEMPPLLHCQIGTPDCCNGLSECGLECLSNSVDGNEGICVATGTCFQHQHCDAEHLCSGDGRCVSAHLYLQNNLNAPIDAQVFSADRVTCPLSTEGFSAHEGISDFAQAHGMCSFRDWYHYQNLTRHTLPSEDGMLHIPDQLVHRTDTHVPLSLRDSQTLKMQAHACDRSYQHSDLGVCIDDHRQRIKASYSYRQGSPDAFDETVSHSQAIRTWQDSSASADIRFCDMGRALSRSNAINGFLSPYEYQDEQSQQREDTLKHVPRTVGRCIEFAVCETPRFTVQGLPVQARLVRKAEFLQNDVRLSQNHRPYSHLDAETCFGAGHMIVSSDAAVRCVLDRMTVPILNFVFTDTPLFLPFDTQYHSSDALSEPWSQPALQLVFEKLRQRCPRAFTQAIDGRQDFVLFVHLLGVMSTVYSPAEAASITRYANLLLPSVFGIDAEAVNDNSRGFQSIEEYLELATCARHVDTSLQDVRNTVFTNNQAYSAESVLQQQFVGDTLYAFHARSPIHMPFRWFWQCVVLSKSPDSGEGGAPRDWFRGLTDESLLIFSEQCEVYEQVRLPSELISIKLRLQSSPHIYTMTDDVPEMAAAMAHDIDDTVAIALAALSLPMFPDLYYMRKSEEGDCHHHNMFVLQSCWKKYGRDATELVNAEEMIRTPDGEEVRSLYHMMRLLIFGQEAYTNDLYDYTLQDLEHEGIVQLSLSLQTQVRADTDFFPAIRFLHLDAYDQIPVSTPRVTGHTIDPAYAVCVEQCESASPELRLQHYEYGVQDGNTVDIDVYRNNAPDRSVVTASEAEYLLVHSFRKFIYFQSSFASNNVHRDTRVSSQFMSVFEHNNLETTAAREYNSFMRTKTFQCGESLAHNLPTNRLHARLADCLKDIQENVGWSLADSQLLHLQVPASLLLNGFMVSFTESTDQENKFLQNLTSPDWASKKYISAQDTMCFQLQGETQTINPYWAVDFDTVSGCDTFQRESLRLTDSRCLTESASQSCAERFPEFDRALKERLPDYCRAHANEVATAKRGTFRPGVSELCDRAFVSPSLCNLRHGTFAGGTGQPVPDLNSVFPAHKQLGLWKFSNSIFRGSVLRTANANHLEALQLLPTDIAGHSMGFVVDDDGQLVLHCVNLIGEARESCLVSNQHWMHNIEQDWEWQHVRQTELWPRSRSTGGPVSWTCPLHILQTYAGQSAKRSIRSPSRDRNSFRFRHITSPSEYAHPIVASSRKLLLMDARFMSDTTACAADRHDSVVSCHSTLQLQNSIAHARELLWQTVTFPKGDMAPGVSCQQILDWPHQPFLTWDEQTHAGTEYDRLHCNVFDRLPQFQIQLQQRASARAHTGRSSVDSGGVCHMGRLRRFHAVPPNNAVLQHCQSAPLGALSCRYFDPETKRSFMQTTAQQERTSPAISRPMRKHRPCAKCESHHDPSFVKLDGTLQDTSDALPMLSTGQHMHISTGRLVSAYLRRLLCPEAALAPCAELLRIFNTSHWTSGKFLQALFAANSSSDFYNSYNSAYQTAEQSSAYPDTEDLWQRNWVWCNPQTSVCSGNISKQAWVNPHTRGPACRAAIADNAQHSSSTVHFCLIDAGTQRLCQLVVEWNAEIANILCRAAGLDTCTDSGFFYNPSSYSADNRKFEHDSVLDFYSSTGVGECEHEGVSQMSELQRQSNQRLLDKCASVNLSPVLAMLLGVREYINLVVELMYYGLQVCFNVVHLLIMACSPFPDGAEAASNKIFLYLRLFMDTISNVIDLLYGAIFELIFGRGQTRMLVDMFRVICQAVQWIEKEVVKNGFCVLLQILSDFYKWLLDLLQQLVGVQIAGVHPLAFLTPTLGNVLLLAHNSVDFTLTIVCHAPPMTCEFGQFDVSDESGPGTLPMVSRCWSAYTTFFGDGQSLACTAADTCKASLTDSTLVMCGACPQQNPPNPLVFQYGCDTIIKSCTCAVPKLEAAYCYSNVECEETGKACEFIDSDMEPLAARTLCQACPSRPVCMVARGSSVGQCACALQELEFARCRPEDLGQLISLPYSKMCILQTDPGFSASMSMVANFAAASTTSCMAVDSSTSYCTRMVDLDNGFYIVSTHTTQSRRLLMDAGSADAADLSAATTQDPTCRDALDVRSDSHVRRECVTRFVRSTTSVEHIGLHADVSRCAFCSSADFWHMLATDPMVLAFICVHPHKLAYIVARHTRLAQVHQLALRLWSQASEFIRVAASSNASDYIGINTSASGFVLSSKNTRVVSNHLVFVLQSLMRWHNTDHNTSRPFIGGHLEWLLHTNDLEKDLAMPQLGTAPTQRALLSLDELSLEMQDEVERAFATQDTYARQISSAFDYNFPAVSSPETQQWMESWPPTLGSSDQNNGNTCKPARDLLFIVYYAFGNTSIAYNNASLAPTTTLRESFPTLRSQHPNSTLLRRNPTSDNGNTDTLLQGMLWCFHNIAKFLGVSNTLFYDIIYSILFEVQNNVQCDLEAIQTCSGWTVTMGNGAVIVFVYFFVIFLALSAFKMEFLALFVVPFLWVFLWRLCYGYSWTCVPLVPVCFIEDLYSTISNVFPKQLLIPQALWRNSTCAALAVIEPDCLKTCQDEPFVYTSIETVVAWMLAEIGADMSRSISLASRVPAVQIPLFRAHLVKSSKVLEDGEAGLVSGNRLCAAINSYRLVPYMALIMLALVLLILALRIVLSIFFGAFSGALAVFLPSFTR